LNQSWQSAERENWAYRERREYLDALNQMCAGLESARVALVKARQRIDGEGR
jgi:hypothetical protein